MLVVIYMTDDDGRKKHGREALHSFVVRERAIIILQNSVIGSYGFK